MSRERNNEGAKKKSKNKKSGTKPNHQHKQQARSTTENVQPQRPQHPTGDTGHQSLAQKRAKHALAKINSIAGKKNSWESNYLAYVKSLPATILMTGLGQALAMEKAGASKKDPVGPGHAHVYKHLNAWLEERWSGTKPNPFDILQAITTNDEPHYLLAQAEALAYLEWLKKFADAYLEGAEGTSGVEGGSDEAEEVNATNNEQAS